MHTASLVLGILSLCGMFLGFVPCLGAFNWINIPFGIIGLVISIMAYTRIDNMPKNNAKAGIIMCAVAVICGLIRLIIGGGVV